MGARVHQLRKLCGYLLVSVAALFLLFLLLDRIFPFPVRIQFSQVIEDRSGHILHTFLTPDGQWRMKMNPQDLSPQLEKALLFKEDKYFFHHPGINPFALIRALWNNIWTHRRTSGASTINMQVARMLDPKPRTYGNKLIEMFRALQLEWHYSKKDILLDYLDLVPYGSNIDGVKSAAELYFGKSPGRLSLAQVSTLAVIPNRPNSLVIGKDNRILVAERNKWLLRFGRARLFPASMIRDALGEPLTAYRHEVPSLAPQFCQRVHGLFPGRSILHTTLDKGIQERCQQMVRDYVSRIRQEGITNASVLIINNRTHQVLTYIGSADFRDRSAHGQVDGVQAIRSPGSTLKPLLYGMAFDQGLYTPRTVIDDIPLDIGGYRPENYDQQFRGQVTVQYALENSLNIPAVQTLNSVGISRFIDRLSLAGFKEIHSDSRDLGLSLILGGCGVSLEELTRLYSALANYGEYYSLQWLRGQEVAHPGKQSGHLVPVPLLSQPAAFMITHILSRLTRPDLPENYANARNLVKIAWKTGTSYGRRDAWTLGYNEEYTVGVWVGNFSGRGVPDLSGAQSATPLLFDIFQVISDPKKQSWFSPPYGLGIRQVCRLSGNIPDTFCKEIVEDYYIPGISSNKVCQHEKRVWVSADGRISYCTACLPGSGYLTRWYPNIDPGLAAYYDSRHIPYLKIPPHNPNCERVFQGAAPSIVSLNNGLEYDIEKKEGQKLMLACTAADGVKSVYWYINDRFFKKSHVNEHLFFQPRTPDIKISCMDDKGRNSNIFIRVKYF